VRARRRQPRAEARPPAESDWFQEVKELTVRVKTMATAGLAFLLLASYFYVRVARMSRTETQPLVLPVSLTQGLVRTPSFKTDIDYWDYEIDLDFESRFHELPEIRDALRAEAGPPSAANYQRDRFYHAIACVTGSESEAEDCSNIPNLVDVSWKLFDGEQLVTQGTSHSARGLAFESGVTKTLGTFRGQRDHRYTIAMDVKADGSRLGITNPKLVVRIPKGYWEDLAVGEGLLRLEASVSGLIGLALALPFVVRTVQALRVGPTARTPKG